MFGLFKRKIKIGKTEEEKRAEALPRNKKVQFEPMEIAEVEKSLNADMREVLKMNPVNYYATKNRYLLCIFWYEEDYSEVYMRFELRKDDQQERKSKMYKIDKMLLRDILRKFGQNIF